MNQIPIQLFNHKYINAKIIDEKCILIEIEKESLIARPTQIVIYKDIKNAYKLKFISYKDIAYGYELFCEILEINENNS